MCDYDRVPATGLSIHGSPLCTRHLREVEEEEDGDDDDDDSSVYHGQ